MTAPTQATAREAVERVSPETLRLRQQLDGVMANLAQYRERYEIVVRNCDKHTTRIEELESLLAATQEELDKMRADAERYRFLQGATESQVWQLFDRAETDEHLNKMIDEARAALSPSQQGEPK